MLGGGGDVAPDAVAGAGDGFGGESSGDLLLGLGWAYVAFGLVAGGGHLQVIGEAHDVAEAVAQHFQQAAPRGLLAFRVRVAVHFGQSDGDTGADPFQAGVA